LSLVAIDGHRALEQIDTNNAGTITRGGGRCAREKRDRGAAYLLRRTMVVKVPGVVLTGEGMNNSG
jgi:hypothetical protein